MSADEGVRVVVVHGSTAQTPTLWNTTRRLRGSGVHVTAFFPGKVPPRKPKGVAAFPISVTPAPSRRRVRSWLRWLPVGRQQRRAAATPDVDRLWLVAAGDQRLDSAVRAADVLVAADRAAVPTVWHLMHHNQHADAVLGYGEAARRISARTGA